MATDELWQPLPAAHRAEAGDPAEPRQQKVRPPTGAQASAGQQQPCQTSSPAAHRLRTARALQGVPAAAAAAGPQRVTRLQERASAAAGWPPPARQVEQGWGGAPPAPAALCCQRVMQVQATAGSQASVCPVPSLEAPSPAAPARQTGRLPLPAPSPVQARQPVQARPLAAAEAPSPAAPARQKARPSGQRCPAAAGLGGPPEQPQLRPERLLQQAQPLRVQAAAVPGAGASRPEGVSECR